jgi:hypothetical protein
MLTAYESLIEVNPAVNVAARERVGVSARRSEVVAPLESTHHELALLPACVSKPTRFSDRPVTRSRVAQDHLVDVIPERLETRLHVVPFVSGDHDHRKPQSACLCL